MKKKLLIILAVAVMFTSVFVLSGCGNNDNSANDESLKYVEDNGELIVGLDDTFAPMGFRDNAGKLVGFDIDLANAVCKNLGIKAKFQPIDWDAKDAELKSKKIDCIWNGMSATPERQESMSLSKKYLNNRIVIMTADKSVNIKSADELKDIQIGTQAESAALETMQAADNFKDFEKNIKEYKSYDEAILDLKAGRTQCIVIDEVLGEYKNSKMGEKLFVSDYSFGDDFYAIGFRKGETELTNKVNDALQALIDDGTAEKISKKWFGKNIVVLEDYE